MKGVICLVILCSQVGDKQTEAGQTEGRLQSSENPTEEIEEEFFNKVVCYALNNQHQ